MPVFPIHFSIPEEKVIRTVSFDELKAVKKKWLSEIIPNFDGHKGYKYKTEDEYYQNYKESWFAVTCKKAGYDCLRHYKILANGCLPVFPDLDQCLTNTMTLFPRCMVKTSTDLFFEHKTSPVVSLDDRVIKKFVHLINKLLEYTMQHLTTRSTAS